MYRALHRADDFGTGAPVSCCFPDLITVSMNPGGGGDFNSSMPGCVCPKVKDVGPFFASSE